MSRLTRACLFSVPFALFAFACGGAKSGNLFAGASDVAGGSPSADVPSATVMNVPAAGGGAGAVPRGAAGAMKGIGVGGTTAGAIPIGSGGATGAMRGAGLGMPGMTPTNGETPFAPGFPAIHALSPALSYLGDGPILASPKLVTIRFRASDPDLTSYLEDFDDRVTTTAWWSTVTAGYCAPVGSATCIGSGGGGGHVVIDEDPRGFYADTVNAAGQSDIRDFLQAHTDSGELPDPTSDTAYLVYTAAESVVSVDGATGCTGGGAGSGFQGYHFWASVRPRSGGDAVKVAYGVFPDCGAGKDITKSVSGALASMATNPQPNDHPAYYMLDAAWLDVRAGDGQAGGLCDGAVTEDGFSLARAWSNQSVAAGHNPCVPASPGDTVYFSAAPATQEVDAQLGGSATVDVVAYSDAPHDAWTLEALDAATLRGENPALELSLSASTVQNGSKVTVTIRPLRPAGRAKTATYLLRSTAGAVFHGWPASVKVR